MQAGVGGLEGLVGPTEESVGIISHGFVYMTAMMELNETSLGDRMKKRNRSLASGQIRRLAGQKPGPELSAIFLGLLMDLP